jgi:hypothetical protein
MSPMFGKIIVNPLSTKAREGMSKIHPSERRRRYRKRLRARQAAARLAAPNTEVCGA